MQKQVTKKIGNCRLLKLADFLEELPPEKFNFFKVVSRGEHNGHTCATVACAIGWTPKVFPRLVKWHYLKGIAYFQVRNLKDEQLPGGECSGVAMYLFGITNEEASMFLPYKYEKLPTSSEFAATLRAFVASRQVEGL